MKTPLGMEVDLGPGYIVLDGNPALPHRERGTATSALSLRPMSIVARSPISAADEHLLFEAVFRHQGTS